MDIPAGRGPRPFILTSALERVCSILDRSSSDAFRRKVGDLLICSLPLLPASINSGTMARLSDTLRPCGECIWRAAQQATACRS
jgi:hypothetical protein